MYVTSYGSAANQAGHKKLIQHLKMTEALRGMGGDAEDFADDASEYGGMANVYLSQLGPVQQAMGGNVDLFSRRMIGNATSISGLGGPFRMQGANVWQKQKAFHDQSIANATRLGQDIMNQTYIDGNPLDVNKKFTRGFSIEEIADVSAQLAYTGDVNFRGDERDFRRRNMKAISGRLGKLSAARNVFGDQDVNTLQERTESLLGSSVGTDDEQSTRILQGIAAEARVLNKDVENMVKAREVIKNTLLSLNKARDSRGINLTYDGSGSITGDLEVTAVHMGSLIDHATAGMPKRVADGMARNMTRQMTKDQESPAARVAKLMQAGMLSGEVDKTSYNQYMAALRSGDTEAASQLARESLPGLDDAMSDPYLYNNALSIMTEKGIREAGSESEYRKRVEHSTKMRDNAIYQGGSLQRNDRLREAENRARRSDIATLERKYDIDLEDAYSEEEQLQGYRDDLITGARVRAREDKGLLERMKNSGVYIGQDEEGRWVSEPMTEAIYQRELKKIDNQEAMDIRTLRAMQGDSIEELNRKILGGKHGIELGRGKTMTTVAESRSSRRSKAKLVDAITASGNVTAYAQLERLREMETIDRDEMEDIRDMDPKERAQRISELVDKTFGDDRRRRTAFNKEVSAEVTRINNSLMRKPDKEKEMKFGEFDLSVGSILQAFGVDAKEISTSQHMMNAIWNTSATVPDRADASKEDAEAAKALGMDKNTTEKLTEGIQNLVKALNEGRRDDEKNYEGNALKVHIVNPNDLKDNQTTLTKDGGG
jgi:hypothetical protein